MPGSLPNLVDIFAEDINRNKCKERIGKCLVCTEESCKTKQKDCKCYFEYAKIKVKKSQF